jgi:hypothetical protein
MNSILTEVLIGFWQSILMFISCIMCYALVCYISAKNKRKCDLSNLISIDLTFTILVLIGEKYLLIKRFCNFKSEAILLSSLGLFFSGNIMVFDFLHFVFFQVQYIHYRWEDYIARLHGNFYIFFSWNSLTEKRIMRLALSVLRRGFQ